MRPTRHDFLTHLPPNPPEYRYHGFSSLKEAIDNEYNQFLEHDDDSPYIIFTDITPAEVNNQDFPGKVDYSSPLHILILTMISLPHEQGSELFNFLIGDKAKEMQVRRLLSFRGATRSKTPDRKKEPDRSNLEKESERLQLTETKVAAQKQQEAELRSFRLKLRSQKQHIDADLQSLMEREQHTAHVGFLQDGQRSGRQSRLRLAFPKQGRS